MKFIETWTGEYINTEKIITVKMRYGQVNISIMDRDHDFEIRLTNEEKLDEDLIPFIVETIARGEVYVIRYKEIISMACFLKKCNE